MKKPTLFDVIQTKPGRDRTPVRRGLFKREPADGDEPVEAVDPEGGRNGAGIIRGASLMAIGEALGHGSYIDEVSLEQTRDLGNASENGVKVRFTHPSMSGDGFGTFLGRATTLEIIDDQIVGNVHFAKSSHKGPDGGDRGGYVLSLAADDPDAFGMSIVFDHDPGAERDFVRDNSESDDDGFDVFTSPAGELNPENYPHVRLAALHGADFVDEPAANPDGLFHTGPTADILKQAESVLEYALGITTHVPEDTGGISAERLRGFFTRFLESRGIVFSSGKAELMSKGNAESELETGTEDTGSEAGAEATVAETSDTGETNETSETDEVATGDDDSIPSSELSRFVENFGATKAVAFLQAGTSFEDALASEFKALKQKTELGADGDRGEETAVGEFASGKDEDSEVAGDRRLPPSVRGMQSIIRIGGSPANN
jgi:hypothetical protein